MRKYKTVFSSFHTLYRLTTSLSDSNNFVIGITKLYKNIFKAEKVVTVCKVSNSHNFIKVNIENKKQVVRKGGLSILTKREKEILKQNREVILNNRMICPFIFVDTLGAVYIKRKTKNDIFDDLDKRWFISLSEQVSIYLKIFSLYQEQRKIMLNYIKSLSNILNNYIPTSYLHTKSVSKLISALGKEMKLTKAEMKSLEYASMLHDAGKLQVPSKLLKKQRPLTNKEYEIIRKHPKTGASLIKDLAALKPVAPIILHHHEKYDGTGYPSRLKKDNIPLGARIMSVIDAFDAMFFGRPYKKRMKLKSIEAELKKQTGKQFDPKVVHSFLKILKNKRIRKYLHSFY